MSKAVAPASDSGSSGPTSKSTFRVSLVTTAAPVRPIAEPRAVSITPRLSTSLMTSKPGRVKCHSDADLARTPADVAGNCGERPARGQKQPDESERGSSAPARSAAWPARCGHARPWCSRATPRGGSMPQVPRRTAGRRASGVFDRPCRPCRAEMGPARRGCASGLERETGGRRPSGGAGSACTTPTWAPSCHVPPGLRTKMRAIILDCRRCRLTRCPDE